MDTGRPGGSAGGSDTVGGPDCGRGNGAVLKVCGERFGWVRYGVGTVGAGCGTGPARNLNTPTTAIPTNTQAQRGMTGGGGAIAGNGPGSGSGTVETSEASPAKPIAGCSAVARTSMMRASDKSDAGLLQ